MLSSIFCLAIAAAVRSVSAQEPDISVDPGSVDLADRQEWCRAQIRSCPSICGGSASPNTCDANTLEFECVCSDGETPDISEYEETLPFYVCLEWRGRCVEQSLEDAEAQQECIDVDCGSKSPNKQSESETDADSTATETETETETETVTSTETVVADGDESETTTADDAEETNAAPMVLGPNTASWSYIALAVVGFAAFRNEL